MRYKRGFIFAYILVFCSCQMNPEASSVISELSGENAMEYVRTQVSFGARPSGSEQLQKCREFMEGELRSFGYEVEDDEFTTETPYGSTQMHNLIDMIGDKDLPIYYETNSTPWLMDLVWETAGKTDFESILSLYKTSIQDDHIPFLDVGIPCVDIIDLSYGPGNSYWHTEQDTLDKISPQSMEKVGRLVLEMLPEIQKRR